MGDHSPVVSKSNPLSYLKAIGSSIATGIAVLLSYVQGTETLADVTTNEWLFVILAILGSFGITYLIPNKSSK